MSKSVLVIDTPKKCMDCPFCVLDSDLESINLICNIDRDEKYISFEYFGLNKPDWCPLLPLPERMDVHKADSPYDLYYKGYNNCLDELQKGNI